jgi:hypothetical protein
VWPKVIGAFGLFGELPRLHQGGGSSGSAMPMSSMKVPVGLQGWVAPGGASAAADGAGVRSVVLVMVPTVPRGRAQATIGRSRATAIVR